MRIEPDKGRCCGRKPRPYKGGHLSERKRVCLKCDREFDYDTGDQVENWAWKRTENFEWVRRLDRKGA